MKTLAKNLSIVVIFTTFFCSNSICQTNESQDEYHKLRTFGFGINFKPDVFGGYYYFYENPSQFLFTLNIKDKLRIEPEFGFSSTSHLLESGSGNSEDDISINNIGIGIYGLKNINQILITYGIKYNRFSNITDRENTIRNSRYEHKAYGIGPSFGVEYLLGKHFSVGTGFSVIYMNRKEKNDYDISDNIIDDETEYKQWSTIAGLQFRFYF